MGTDKARVTINGEPLLTRVSKVAAVVGDVVVVGGTPSDDVTPIPDLRTGRLGPLAGLESALAYAQGRDVILLGVDQPFVRSETLLHLTEIAGDVVVPVHGGWEQVLCAVYREAFLPVTRTALDAGKDLSILSYLDQVNTTRVHPDEWAAWEEDGRSWYSTDTPEALSEGIERFG